MAWGDTTCDRRRVTRRGVTRRGVARQVPVVVPVPDSAAHATIGFVEENIRLGFPSVPCPSLLLLSSFFWVVGGLFARTCSEWWSETRESSSRRHKTRVSKVKTSRLAITPLVLNVLLQTSCCLALLPWVVVAGFCVSVCVCV